jgi:hypothetical protein
MMSAEEKKNKQEGTRNGKRVEEREADEKALGMDWQVAEGKPEPHAHQNCMVR